MSRGLQSGRVLLFPVIVEPMIHLPHVLKIVRTLKEFNGYNFEDYNGKLRSYIHGSHDVAKEIQKRFSFDFDRKIGKSNQFFNDSLLC